MWAFFKGWRREAGVVLLMMACVLFVGWMRSRVVEDEMSLRFQRGHFAIVSTLGKIEWDWMENGPYGTLNWSVHDNSDVDITNVRGFERHASRSDFVPYFWTAPYWSLVLPLSVISALLLLWPQRKGAT